MKVEPTPGSLSTRHLAAEQLAPASATAAGRGRCPCTRRCSGFVDLGELLEDPLLVLGGDADAGVGAPRRRPCRRRRRRGAATRTSPRSVNLSALEMKLRRICDTLPSSVCSGGRPSGSSKTQRDRVARPAAAAACRAARRTGPRPSNSAGRTSILPASTLARSSRSLTSSDRSSAALRMKRDLLLLLARSAAPSMRSSSSRDSAQDRVQRRAELVAHVRQEARLHLVGAPQVVGLLVELGVERDHAAVGVLELAVERARARPAAARSSLERAQQLLVLLLQLLDRRRGAAAARAPRDAAEPRRRDERRARAAAACSARPSCPRRARTRSSKRSISRRAPTMPRPMPVVER